jgi:ChrR Cupin-like domain
MSMQDLHGQAALYLLGHLSGGEAREFDNGGASAMHRQALAEMTELMASIGAGAVEPAAPPPALKGKLFERIEKNPYPGLFSKRAHEQGPWRPTKNPGVSFKKLYFDKASGLITMLVKMEPGARLGDHSHRLTEQCLILEGDLRYSEEKIYRAGDFTWAEAGSLDPALYTVDGNLLLIISEP